MDEINAKSEKFKDSQERMKYFIRTSSETAIYWLPKDHTDITFKLLQDRQKQVSRSNMFRRLSYSIRCSTYLQIAKTIAERDLEDQKKKNPLERKLEDLNNSLTILNSAEDLKSSEGIVNQDFTPEEEAAIIEAEDF